MADTLHAHTPAATPATAPRPLTNTLKMMMFGPLAVISFGVFVLVYLGSGHTDHWFAWTTTSPLTAATLGAGFLAAAVLFAASGLEYRWADTRVAAFAPIPLLGMILFASLADRERLHLSAGLPIIGTIVAGLWLVAFAALPLLVALALLAQLTLGRGGPAPHAVPLPVWARNLVELFALTLIFIGVVFYVAPTTFTSWWPWAVDRLDLRVLCSWSATLGFGALIAVWEDDLDRVRAGLSAFLTFGVLELGAIGWYRHELAWHRPGAWIFLGLTSAMIAVGGLGFRLAGTPTAPPE